MVVSIPPTLVNVVTRGLPSIISVTDAIAPFVRETLTLAANGDSAAGRVSPAGSS